MKKSFYLVLAVATLATLCMNCNSKKANTENTAKTENADKTSASTDDTLSANAKEVLLSLNYDSLKIDWNQKFDFNQDISNLSVQDLRLLRNYPYAINGLYFMEADLHSYFVAQIPWYSQYMTDMFDEGNENLLLEYEDVKLSDVEKQFVERVDKRIAELQKSMYITRNNYVIGNASNIVNLFQFKNLKQDFMDKIAQNNFVITRGNNLQLFHVYEASDYGQIPNFITTDLFLQAFHMYFSYVLKSLEQEKFIPAVGDLCLGLYNESMNLVKSQDTELAQMAAYNATFYAIPYTLLTGKKLTVPEKYKNAYKTEVDNATKALDCPSAFLSTGNIYFPYSLFKPRGHYTRKPEMQAYFRAMMWLQVAYFCRDNDAQLKQCIFTASLLNTTKTSKGKSLTNVYSSVFDPVAFLVGQPDNLSIMDITRFLKNENINNMQQALNAKNIEKVNQMLIKLTDTRNLIKPKIEITCPDKINFMPQRYLIDNEVMQNLVDLNPNSKRSYPKGLDVFSAFGSTSANNLLNNFYKEKENWADYPKEMDKLQKKFQNYDGWNQSVYNKWIESLLSLQKANKDYPVFMQTKAWDYKNLNTSLASWAELKHDAILYGEQPMAAECGGGEEPPEPVVLGYVEPNILFWNKLNELITLTRNMLTEHDLLSEDLAGKTKSLLDYVNFLIEVSKKELAKEPLSNEQFSTIEYLGSSIEWFTLSVIEPDLNLDSWSLVEGPDRSIAQVADIYTRDILGCNKSGILHVAVGKANNIYVVVEINGYLRLAKGATFSYYEFVQPLGTRLTDEEWQKIEEDNSTRPPIPEWMQDIITGNEPSGDAKNFYSSGC